jgi:hypothetical protein
VIYCTEAAGFAGGDSSFLEKTVSAQSHAAFLGRNIEISRLIAENNRRLGSTWP